MKRVQPDDQGEEKLYPTAYSGRFFSEPIPKWDIPEQQMPSAAALQLVRDELNLDGNPALNLASFVTTWMEPEAHQLAHEAINKNIVDQDEYPQTQHMYERVVTMIARLFNAPGDGEAAGSITEGSSEAIMLGMLAHKWAWRERRKAEGKPAERPNVVMGADVHTCWEKFTRYFDVEARVVPMEEDDYTLSAADVESRIDENTIAVGAVLGTTFTGQVDDIKGIDALLRKVKKEKGWDIPIHVDAASGGFIAPFVYPEFEWDFRLERVKSINVSNHKFGLVFPGMGTVVFRDRAALPEGLVFKINYLGGEMDNYSLNFSRSAAIMLLQYYNFLRLGREGYERIMKNIMENAKWCEEQVVKRDRFELLNDTRYLPVVVARARKGVDIDVFELSARLRERGWIVPAYSLPPNAEDVNVLRVVVRENFSRDMAMLLGRDLTWAREQVEGKGAVHMPTGGPDKAPGVC